MVHKSSRLPIRLVSLQKTRCSLTRNVLQRHVLWGQNMVSSAKAWAYKENAADRKVTCSTEKHLAMFIL